MTGGAEDGRRGSTCGLTSWDGVSEHSLAQALIPPATDCVEVGTAGRRRRRGLADRRLGLTLTTRSAYNHPVAKVFTGALANRLPLSRDLRECLHTALHESIINAVMHGNLGVGSQGRDTLQDLAATHDVLVAGTLAGGAVARSSIHVSAHWTKTVLRVVVRDSGQGFNRHTVPTADERREAGRIGSGRGLEIVQALCDRVTFLYGGTAIALSFKLTGEPNDTSDALSPA